MIPLSKIRQLHGNFLITGLLAIHCTHVQCNGIMLKCFSRGLSIDANSPLTYVLVYAWGFKSSVSILRHMASRRQYRCVYMNCFSFSPDHSISPKWCRYFAPFQRLLICQCWGACGAATNIIFKGFFVKQHGCDFSSNRFRDRQSLGKRPVKLCICSHFVFIQMMVNAQKMIYINCLIEETCSG